MCSIPAIAFASNVGYEFIQLAHELFMSKQSRNIELETREAYITHKTCVCQSFISSEGVYTGTVILNDFCTRFSQTVLPI